MVRPFKEARGESAVSERWALDLGEGSRANRLGFLGLTPLTVR